MSVYLSNFEVETKRGAITPIEREGHRYAFSHTLASGGYRAADYTAVGQQNLYVFVDSTTDVCQPPARDALPDDCLEPCVAVRARPVTSKDRNVVAWVAPA